jgi:hypothetical protein
MTNTNDTLKLELEVMRLQALYDDARKILREIEDNNWIISEDVVDKNGRRRLHGERGISTWLTKRVTEFLLTEQLKAR